MRPLKAMSPLVLEWFISGLAVVCKKPCFKISSKTFCRPAFPKIPEPNGLILNSRINSY